MDDIKELIEQTKTLRVLYVEDDESTRIEFLALFEILFQDIQIATNGIEALEFYTSTTKKFDLVITDINMPKMDGIQLLKEIKAIQDNQKIIILTAYNDAQHLLEAIQFGASDFILKPLDVTLLKKSLLKVVHTIYAEKLLMRYNEELKQELEKKTEQLINQLMHDDVTNLLNRKALNKKLETQTDKILALLNIDKFDSINITYGYKNADLLLKKISEELELFCTHNASLYYIGADEFVIVYENVEISIIENSLKRIQGIIKEKEFHIDTFTIKCTLSIAVAQGSDYLLKNAHIALKESKIKGKNRFTKYNGNIALEKFQHQIKEYTPLIKEAVKEFLIVPYFQPIIDNKTGKIEKFEALARIVDKAQKTHQPASFIKVAELTGMIPDITHIMIDKTFQVFQKTNYSFSINISQQDLNDTYLVDYFKLKTKQYNIDPSRVIIEILEGADNHEIHYEIEQLQKLKEFGFLIAIDDFGAENSNFERVHAMNVDFIKIDGQFIKDIDTNKKSYNIAKTITMFAHSLGAKVVAEFVHSKEVLEKIQELGIDYSQGYYFSEPKPSL